jgi:hypothetical protein
LYVWVEERSAPTRCGAKLLNAQANRAAQIGAFEVRTLEAGVADDSCRQHGAAQVGVLEIGV